MSASFLIQPADRAALVIDEKRLSLVKMVSIRAFWWSISDSTVIVFITEIHPNTKKSIDRIPWYGWQIQHELLAECTDSGLKVICCFHGRAVLLLTDERYWLFEIRPSKLFTDRIHAIARTLPTCTKVATLKTTVRFLHIAWRQLSISYERLFKIHQSKYNWNSSLEYYSWFFHGLTSLPTSSLKIQ